MNGNIQKKIDNQEKQLKQSAENKFPFPSDYPLHHASVVRKMLNLDKNSNYQSAKNEVEIYTMTEQTSLPFIQFLKTLSAILLSERSRISSIKNLYEIISEKNKLVAVLGKYPFQQLKIEDACGEDTSFLPQALINIFVRKLMNLCLCKGDITVASFARILIKDIFKWIQYRSHHHIPQKQEEEIKNRTFYEYFYLSEEQAKILQNNVGKSIILGCFISANIKGNREKHSSFNTKVEISLQQSAPKSTISSTLFDNHFVLFHPLNVFKVNHFSGNQGYELKLTHHPQETQKISQLFDDVKKTIRHPYMAIEKNYGKVKIFYDEIAQQKKGAYQNKLIKSKLCELLWNKNPSQGLKHCKQLLEEIKGVGVQEVQLLLYAGRAAMKLCEFEEAVKYYDDILTILKENQKELDPKRQLIVQFQAKMNISKIRLSKQPQKSIQTLNQCLEMIKKQDSSMQQEQYQIYSLLSEAFRANNQIEEALKQLQLAETLIKTNKEKFDKELMIITNNKAVLQAQKKDYKMAAKSFKNVVSSKRNKGWSKIEASYAQLFSYAVSLGNLGNSQCLSSPEQMLQEDKQGDGQKNMEQAIKLLQKIIDEGYKASKEEIIILARFHHLLGNHYFSKQQYGLAKTEMTKAKQLYKQQQIVKEELQHDLSLAERKQKWVQKVW